MINFQRWKDCSPVLLILISWVRVNINFNSHHKRKEGFISRKQEHDIEQKKGCFQRIADTSYLKLQGNWDRIQVAVFLQAFNNRRCSFIDIFVVWTFRESSRTFFLRTNGRWVFAEISNSMLKLRRKWSFKRQYCVSSRSGFCDIWSFRDLASLFSFTPSSQYLDFNFSENRDKHDRKNCKSKTFKANIAKPVVPQKWEKNHNLWSFAE